MSYHFRNLARFTYLLLSGGAGSPITFRRIALLAAFYLFYPPFELHTWLAFGLDGLLFRSYRRQQVRQPVFIIGNFRSGSTFLHRLLARDEQTFTTLRLWEILFAPSIVQRKAWQALGALDRWLGSPLRKGMAAWQASWHEQHARHRVSMWSPEEDEYLLLHAWSTLAIWLYAALLDEAEPYTCFDEAVPAEEKRRVMGFYHRCVQRHLHAHGGRDGRRFLSKNPWFSPKVDALYQHYPDARIIYLVRNPLQAVPSYLSFMDYVWRALGQPAGDPALTRYVLRLTRHWYTYPLERLQRAPADSYVVVKFQDLVANPGQTVTDIYHHFGLQIRPAFAEVLRWATERSRNYRSRHTYSLTQLGLSREQILAEYADVMERFGFDPGA